MNYLSWKDLKEGDAVFDRRGNMFEVVKILNDDFAYISEICWSDNANEEYLGIPFRAYRKDYIE